MRNFKRILKTVSLFLAVIIVLSVVFGALYLRGENYDYQDYRERDALAGELTMLINGASYVMYGIDPDVLDAYLGANVHSYNLTTSMLTLEGRYALLKKELERNPVKTVILEVSPDTKIILNSIYPVADSYKYQKSINNEKIDAANGWIEALAEELGLRFLYSHEAVEVGGKLPESSHNGDGLHLNGESFGKVMDYIRTHALPEYVN